jgi:hypothetical protein
MKLLLETIDNGKHSVFKELSERSYVIGRDLTADIPVANEALSRRHAIFLSYPSGWCIVDLHSTNGVWLNGMKLDAGVPAVLKDGDYIQLADMVWKVRCVVPDLTKVASGFRLFALRGEQETIELDPQSFDGSIVTEFGIAFELRDGGLYLEFDDPNAIVLRNQVRLYDNTQVHAGDVIVCSDFQFLVVFGQLAKTEVSKHKPEVSTERARVVHDLIGEERESSTVFTPHQTTMIDSDRVNKIRFGRRDLDEVHNDDMYQDQETTRPAKQMPWNLDTILSLFEELSDTERRVLFAILFFLFASMIVFVLWFVF